MDLESLRMSVDFKEICRLCMKKEANMTHLFAEEDNLSEKVMDFAPALKLSTDDGLPAQVCSQCVQRVHECSYFKVQCETTDATLRQLYNFKHTQVEDFASVTVKQEPDINLMIEEEPLHFDSSDELGEQPSIEQNDDSITNTAPEGELVDKKTDLKQEIHADTSSGNETSHQIESESKETKCTECGMKFLNLILLKDHMAVHTSKKKLSCKFCERQFSSRRSRISHYSKEHPDEKPFECNICSEKFKIQADLKKHGEIHFQIAESGIKKYICHICGQLVVNAYNLKLHRFTHTGEKPFLCNICGKSYNNKKYLNIHKVIHSGEKPHLCEECGARFSQQTTLRVHLLTHTGEKRFSCDECKKSFGSKSQLQAHIFSHSGERRFVCKECNKTFARKDCLLQHKRLHSGILPYLCTVCGKRFDRKRSLDEHKWTHSGQKPFSCEHCGKGFMRTPYLKYHLSNTHGIKD